MTDLPRIGAPPPVQPAAMVKLVDREHVALALELPEGHNAAVITRDEFEAIVYTVRQAMGWW